MSGNLDIRNITLDYGSGHVLIDGRPIGCFVAEQGPEVVASPAKDLYIVNVPLFCETVTFLPSGEAFTAPPKLAVQALSEYTAAIKDTFAGSRAPATVTVDQVRLAVTQVAQSSGEIDRIMRLVTDQSRQSNE